jgi:AcrR family transcriptional regulator
MSSKREQTDPRVKRTLQLIKDALLSLIDEKGFDQITVRDLTERADINRATFYLHFPDKIALLERTVEDMLQAFHSAIQLPPTFEAGDLSLDADSPPPSFVRQFEHMAENARFYKVMLGRNGLPGFASRLEKEIADALYHRSHLAQPQDRQLRVPRELIIRYATSAHLGLTMLWLEQDMPYTPLYMATQLKRLHMLGPTHVSLDQKEDP